MLVSLEADTEELSFLLHKHPGRLHTQDSSFGRVHVFYPAPRQAVLLMEVEPLKLTRRGGSSVFALQPYVNDRPYVASSFLSVALNQMFRTAIAGRCESHPELVETPLELTLSLPVVQSRGGESLLRNLFEPLGYSVEATALPLDQRFPQWGASSYFKVVLKGRTQLYRALRHLYILMPVLDNDKHYWVSGDEVDKLLERGEGWLADHPERELIVIRYLKHRKDLSKHALSSLAPLEDAEGADDGSVEARAEKRLGLHDERLDTVAALIASEGSRSVADLGCGEGKLLKRLLKLTSVERVLGMDVSTIALERTAANLERVAERQLAKLQLFQGSLGYDDERLHDLDAAVLVEVIEHIDPERLPRVAHQLFARLRPKMLVITTPNRDYNAAWETLPAGRFRHGDHRFEWSREEFDRWCEEVRSDYSVEITGLGPTHETLGCPTQMAVFRR